MIAPNPNPPQELVNVQIDGQWVQVPKGTNAIEAAKTFGKLIPHYCYHPKLQVVGNCRMCLIELATPRMGPDRKPVLGADGRPELNWMPRPRIGCATNVSEGMGIRTTSPLVEECRKGVMEFLLINHPLDCPICDQAGECKLQEFSVDFGTGDSRFVEDKIKKPKRVDLGPRIVLDNERCILCTRCIRFTKDVVGDDALGIVNRGNFNCISAFPGRQFDNNYTLNTVDICPVGALTSKDFRFKMRVWFLKETPSICTSCGTGCNTLIGSREGVMHRMTPRDNEAVNQCWMCDHGRLNFRYLQDPARLLAPETRTSGAAFKAEWTAILPQLRDRLRTVPGARIAILASARMTNEELFLTRALASELGAAVVETLPRPQAADHLLVCNDGNPNTTGARLTGVGSGGSQLAALADGIRAGRFDAVLTLGEDLAALGLDPGEIARIPLLVALSLLPNATTAAAHYLLPGAGFAEKRGSMVSIQGRIQRLNRATVVPGRAKDDWEILDALLNSPHGSFENVFAAMAASVPAFAGLTFNRIGDLGIDLAPQPAAAS
jgi:NADH-quinone oxidoreductase subunit G